MSSLTCLIADNVMRKVKAEKRGATPKESASRLLKDALGYRASQNSIIGEWTAKATSFICTLDDRCEIMHDFCMKKDMMRRLTDSNVNYFVNPVIMFCCLSRCSRENSK